jgi:hypothetical protein
LCDGIFLGDKFADSVSDRKTNLAQAALRVKLTSTEITSGSVGIAVVRKKNGSVGWAKLAQHSHTFPFFTAIPNEPYITNLR